MNRNTSQLFAAWSRCHSRSKPLQTWGLRSKPRAYGRYFVFKCPKCGLISAATISTQNQLKCLKTGHPTPLKGCICGCQPTFKKTICKVGLRPIKEGDAPLTMTEGFKDLADTVESVREMREAQDGGVLATAKEQAELEAALGDEAGGGGGGGGGAAAAAASAAAFQAAAEAAAASEDVEVELSQQLGNMASPSKPPAPKKLKKGGEGGSSSDRQ